MLLVVRSHVGAVEPLRLLAVELDRAHLPRATHRVVHEEVDLRAVERAFALGDAVGQTHPVDRGAEHPLGEVPLVVRPEPVVRAGRELRMRQVADAEPVVEELEVVEHPVDLVLDVLLGTEDVRVVLAELPRACQPLQRAGRLVAVQNGGLGVADREIAIAP